MSLSCEVAYIRLEDFLIGACDETSTQIHVAERGTAIAIE